MNSSTDMDNTRIITEKEKFSTQLASDKLASYSYNIKN